MHDPSLTKQQAGELLAPLVLACGLAGVLQSFQAVDSESSMPSKQSMLVRTFPPGDALTFVLVYADGLLVYGEVDKLEGVRLRA